MQDMTCRQHITADKRRIFDSPKLPAATSFIRKTLGEIIYKEVKQ